MPLEVTANTDRSFRLRATFNHAAVGIAVAALDGRFLDMNRKFSDIVGFTREQLVERTVAEITHPDDVALTQASLQQFYQERVPPAEVHLPLAIEDAEAIEAWLSNRGGRRVRLLVPQRGDKKALQTIKGRYEADDSFRRFVVRYVEQFESLLNQANESDPENLLSSTFVTSDVGKLYVLLSRATGRMN